MKKFATITVGAIAAVCWALVLYANNVGTCGGTDTAGGCGVIPAAEYDLIWMIAIGATLAFAGLLLSRLVKDTK